MGRPLANLEAGVRAMRPDLVIIDKLAAFSGATGMQRGILDSKINTIVGGDSRDPDGKGHIPPTELSEEENEIIRIETRVFSEKLR